MIFRSVQRHDQSLMNFNEGVGETYGKIPTQLCIVVLVADNLHG